MNVGGIRVLPDKRCGMVRSAVVVVAVAGVATGGLLFATLAAAGASTTVTYDHVENTSFIVPSDISVVTLDEARATETAPTLTEEAARRACSSATTPTRAS